MCLCFRMNLLKKPALNLVQSLQNQLTGQFPFSKVVA